MIQLILALCVQASASNYTWDLVPILPKCQGPGIHCTKEEMPEQVKKAGIVQRLKEMTDRAELNNGKIRLAFMSFTEPALLEVLCAAGKKGVQIEGFFHSNASGENGFGTKMTNDCQKSARRKNVVMHYMGMPKNGTSGWRLHHNKFFLVDHGAGKNVEIAFGSANLSSQGLSVNYENWNFFSGPRDLPFVKNHLCDIDAMRAARKAKREQDDPKVFRTKLDECLAHKDVTPGKAEEILEREGVVSFFSPDPKDRAFKVLADQIDKVVAGGRIRMAVYFFMHKPLIEKLKAAVARGVEVQLLVDDDIYLGGSIPAQKRFWDGFIKPEQSGFKVRAFDTNEGAFQLQHNKYLVLEGVGSRGVVRVFGGAGQFTLSAFQNNYENFFLVSDPAVTRAYGELFTDLWRIGADVRP